MMMIMIMIWPFPETLDAGLLPNVTRTRNSVTRPHPGGVLGVALGAPIGQNSTRTAAEASQRGVCYQFCVLAALEKDRPLTTSLWNRTYDF